MKNNAKPDAGPDGKEQHATGAEKPAVAHVHGHSREKADKHIPPAKPVPATDKSAGKPGEGSPAEKLAGLEDRHLRLLDRKSVV
jgi:hypothetical protein